jgi:hypothetical protein
MLVQQEHKRAGEGMEMYLHFVDKIKEERKIHTGQDNSAFHSPGKKWQHQVMLLYVPHCPLW